MFYTRKYHIWILLRSQILILFEIMFNKRRQPCDQHFWVNLVAKWVIINRSKCNPAMTSLFSA